MEVVLYLILGFFIGGLLRAKFAVNFPELWLKRFFGCSLIALGFRMMFSR